jgi:hypothetical protein
MIWTIYNASNARFKVFFRHWKMPTESTAECTIGATYGSKNDQLIVMHAGFLNLVERRCHGSSLWLK